MAPPQKRKYEELKIRGPPLYSQGNFADEQDTLSKRGKSIAPRCPSIDPTQTALLIVDVQPEYWSECPAVRKDFPHFPAKMSSLIENCRSQGMKCIWVRADYSYDRSPWLQQFTRLHQGRIPPVVRPSSKWEGFATPEKDELVVTKTSWSSTTDTCLLDILRNAGIDTVLVSGLITSVCVQHSAFGVFEAGYRTILVTDACADRGKERHEAALALYGDYMYELRTVRSVQRELVTAVDKTPEKIVKSDSFASLTSSMMTSHTSLSSLDQEEIEEEQVEGGPVNVEVSASS
ncbi:unnamed protein product [Cylindrotheca closterium]|uniref:Isochorismatase-like domain-containing protein n=1 Tax=Cylindrotheca closterium TaxID=2856 RepID=A0AAD2CGR5_9STRA|nr:unnamed protein product [Cylindrotheca closterium]